MQKRFKLYIALFSSRSLLARFDGEWLILLEFPGEFSTHRKRDRFPFQNLFHQVNRITRNHRGIICNGAVHARITRSWNNPWLPRNDFFGLNKKKKKDFVVGLCSTRRIRTKGENKKDIKNRESVEPSEWLKVQRSPAINSFPSHWRCMACPICS